MQLVKVKKTFYVDHSGITYNEGDEAEVSDELAKRHADTGFLEIKTTSDKKKEK